MKKGLFFYKEKILNLFLSAVIVLLPFCSLLLYMICSGNGINIKSFIPCMGNDEYYYYFQISSMIKYGFPLGYFGFNESISLIGNLGAWSIFLLLPYVVLGKIIGWNYYSMVWCNIIFLTLAMYIYIKILKPTVKQKIWIIVIYIFEFQIINTASFLSMTESLRCAMSIIMMTLLLKILITSTSIKFRFVTILVSFVFVLAYLPFILMLFLITFYSFNKEIKQIFKIVVPILVTITSTLFSLLINSVFSSKYFVPYNKDLFIEALLKGTMFEKINNLITLTVKIFGEYLNIFKIKPSDSIFIFFTIYSFIILFIFLKFIYENKKNKTPLMKRLYYCLFIIMLGFLIGNIMLNTTSPLSLKRSLLCSWSMFFISVPIIEKSNTSKGLLLILSLAIIPSSFASGISSLRYQYTVYKDISRINDEKEKLSKIFPIDDQNTKDSWDYTIDDFGLLSSPIVLSFPEGYGINLLTNIEPKKAKYVLIEKNSSATNNRKSFNGYQLIFEDEYFIIYNKQ